MTAELPAAAPSLDAIRARIDQIDTEILKLVDERSALAHDVAAAKKAAGGPVKFGLRPGREALIMRKLLKAPRQAASASLVVRLWREMIAASLAIQGPFHIAAWGDRDLARVVELARLRFGIAPPLTIMAKPDLALAQARTLGGVAVLSIDADSHWWGRLLAEPKLKIFAALPCLNAWGEMGAVAVADVEVEPTGADQTFWVTDAGGSAASIVETLGKDGVAAEQLAASGGLRLFRLSGFYQKDDPRLARAPGRLSGIIGSAPEPFDLLS
jgi:chorismate mutase